MDLGRLSGQISRSFHWIRRRFPEFSCLGLSFPLDNINHHELSNCGLHLWYFSNAMCVLRDTERLCGLKRWGPYRK